MASAELAWDGTLPGDLRVAVHRLNKRQVELFVVGPAVRDAMLNGTMDKTQRIDLIAIAQTDAEVESCLDGASTPTLFFSRPERLRRSSLAVSVQEAESGNTIRRLVLTVVPTRQALVEELARREVTVNAVALAADGRIEDPFGGMEDLKRRLIRPLFPVESLFAERPIFLFKVAKNLAFHGFEVDPETERAATRCAINALDVPLSRIRPELERLLVNLYPELGLDFLERCGVLPYILPELQLLVGFEDSCHIHHKDIWEHTRKVVGRAKANAAVRWAALLHDIGKSWTRTVDERQRVHFFRHEELSARLFVGIAARFGLEERFAERVHFLILNHSRVNLYSPEWTDSAVRRLARETDGFLDDLISLSRADITSRQERRVEELLAMLDQLEDRVKSLAAEDARQPELPKGAGQIIMRHFGLPPGPLVGVLRKSLEEAVREGRLPPAMPMEAYMGYLEEFIRREGRKLPD